MRITTLDSGLPLAVPHTDYSFSSLAARLHAGLMRGRSRGCLRRLDAYQLRDVGLTREQALAEANKPFWIR